MHIERALVVDDEPLMRNFVADTLQRKKIEVVTAENGAVGLKLLQEQSFDLLLSDMKMPLCSGIDLLKAAKQLHPRITVILMTAFASVENAVEAMRLGAFNYLIKPFSPNTLETLVEKATEHASLLQENLYLREEAKRPLHEVIAQSSLMKQILDDVSKIASSTASVMITGESGTGKEVIARAIHAYSPRAAKSFIKVNCAAIPDTLIESEFFGHEKGAFTGALTKRLGRFELAHQGTLLLDEVTEIPLALQAKLLRVIQEREFERVGGIRPLQVDVRLIATSNRNMLEAVAQKVLREDLYYRLNVVPIHLPPLREHKEDIPSLADYFLQRLCHQNGKETKRLSAQATKALLEYSWPGNIRELANLIERTVVMHTVSVIEPCHLQFEAKRSQPASLPREERLPLGLTLAEIEKRYIQDTLASHNYNRTQTAAALGISIRGLRNKLKCLQNTHFTLHKST